MSSFKRKGVFEKVLMKQQQKKTTYENNNKEHKLKTTQYSRILINIRHLIRFSVVCLEERLFPFLQEDFNIIVSIHLFTLSVKTNRNTNSSSKLLDFMIPS